MVSTRTLLQIAGWGGVIVSSTGFYLQNKLVERVKESDFYKIALKTLRTHPGAVHYLGEPIKDKRFKLTDPENNSCDSKNAKFCIPVSGPKDKAKYYFWADKINDTWIIKRAELELKSKPDERLVIVKHASNK